MFGFDIQKETLANALALLHEKGLSERVSLIEANHARMRDCLPEIREEKAHRRGQWSIINFLRGHPFHTLPLRKIRYIPTIIYEDPII